MTRKAAGERPVFLSTAPAEPADRRLAAVVLILSFLIFVSLAPFAKQPLPHVWAFIPIYESAVAISDFVTAVIFFIQFKILRSRALLALASGYLFTALTVIPHLLTFPEVFSPTGLLGAGPQSTAWLYIFWHGGFPLAVVAYALLKDRNETTGGSGKSPRRALLVSFAAVIVAAVGVTVLATAGQDLLPAVMVGNKSGVGAYVGVSTNWLLALAALLMLWRRRHTVLDLWLMVVMCAWLFDMALSALLNNGRFDLGFYAGRAYGLLASTFVLVVLLLETGTLYARLAELFEVEHRQRLREAEERRRIFETSLDLILIADEQGHILQASPSSMAILAYEPAEMVGRGIGEFVLPDDLEAAHDQMRRARSGHPIQHFAARHLHKDGRIVTLAWSGVWFEPEQRHFFIGRDVTEQKRLERMKDEFIAVRDQLARAEREAIEARAAQEIAESRAALVAELESKNEELEAFSYSVAHDLRAPLRSIDGFGQILLEDYADKIDDEGRQCLNYVRESAQQMACLIDDLLALSRVTRGEFRRAAVDLGAIARSVSAGLAQASPDRRVELVVADDLRADGDDGLLTIALQNLIGNAWKFTGRRGDARIEVGVTGDEPGVYFVRDNGAGFDMAYASKLFGMFQRLHDARDFEGTGIGLTTVQRIVRRHGGRIWAEGVVGEGATFFFTLQGNRVVEPTAASAARPALSLACA
jgi:PAS domain S-box-containing protein